MPIVTSAKYAEICDVRIALEGLAAEKAALLIADSELDRLDKLCAEVTAAAERHDAPTYFAQNQEMHFSVYRAARSPLLLDIIEGIWLRVGPTLNYLFHDIRFAGREAVAQDISHAMVWLVQHLPQSDEQPSNDSPARK